MRKFLCLALLLPIAGHAAAVHQAEWGVAKTFNFELYNTDGTLDVDEVDAGTEVSLSCDEGAEGTATNDFIDRGTTYSIALTAAELQCARVVVVVAATDTNVLYIETYGHPDAHNPCPAGNCATFGTAQASTASTIVLAAATSFADDILRNATVEISHGTGAGQYRICTDWVSSTDTCTVHEDWITTPDTTSKYFVRRESRGVIATGADNVAESNVKQVNDVAITGDGSATPFDVAP